MKNILKQSCFLLLTFSMLSVSSAMAASDFDKGGYEKQNKMDAESLEMAKTRNQEVVFYGKVEDFDGNPVSGAEIKMNVRVFGAKTPGGNHKKAQATTDDNGLFSVETFGELVKVDEINKHGYIYSFRYNSKRSVHSALKEMRKGVSYEPDKPMVFRLRKLAPAAFMFTGGMSFGSKDGRTRLLDIFQNKWMDSDRLINFEKTNPHWHPDLKATVQEEGNAFFITIEALDPSSGFVVEDVEFLEEMTEAPESGYVQTLVLPVEKDGSGKLFAYVKNESGLFFSRLRLEYSNNKNHDYVMLRWGYQTNVTGGRGLEYTDEIYSQYLSDVSVGKRKQLHRENLRQGEQVIIPTPEAIQ